MSKRDWTSIVIGAAVCALIVGFIGGMIHGRTTTAADKADLAALRAAAAAPEPPVAAPVADPPTAAAAFREVPFDKAEMPDGVIPWCFQGSWHLIVYAGPDDVQFAMGDFERLDVAGFGLTGPGLKHRPTGYALSGLGIMANRTYGAPAGDRFVVMTYAKPDQIFVSARDAEGRVYWRGCYVSPTVVNEVGIQNRVLIALAALSACKAQWPDFGPQSAD